jgi:hypothetical protein
VAEEQAERDRVIDDLSSCARLLGIGFLCAIGIVAARGLQAQSDSRIVPFVKYAAATAIVALLSGAFLANTADQLVLAAALMISGALGLRNAPTRWQLRVRELVAPRLTGVLAAFEAEASRLLDEADRQDALHRQARQALRRGDLSGFRTAVAQITDIDRKRDAVDSGYRSLLSDAAEAGRTDFVRALLERGADVNRADTYRGGYTPIQLAAQRGHVSTVRAILEGGADVNARDQWGHTALWYASTCHGGHIDAVTLLLHSGADPTIADMEGRTPLVWATMNEPKLQNAAVVAALRAASRTQQ